MLDVCLYDRIAVHQRLAFVILTSANSTAQAVIHDILRCYVRTACGMRVDCLQQQLQLHAARSMIIP
jgi:hypothetical protein